MRSLIDLVLRLSYTLTQGSLEREISQVVYDSRKAEPDCLFVCIPGAVSDGHDFVEDVVVRGAAAVVAERPVSVPPCVTVLQVPSARAALAELAAAWFGHPADELTVIGVTGTKGKTTTTYMIRQMLERAGRPAGLMGTIEAAAGEARYPAVNTTPESFLIQSYLRRMADAGQKYAVMEVSSQALKLSRTAGFTFDYGVFTNLEPDHIGPAEHPDLADYIRCKSLLFQQCRVGILNADADHLDQILDRHTCETAFYGFRSTADLWASDLRRIRRPGGLGVTFSLHGLAEHSVAVNLPGSCNVSNALAAIAVGLRLGLPWADIQGALQDVQVRGRTEQVPVPGPYTLMIDYAHNAMSLEALLTELREYHPDRILCCFGCGGNRARARRWEMGAVSARLADLTVVTSDNPRWEDPEAIIADILTGVHAEGGAYVTIPDRREAIRYCMETGRPGDVIVLAGKGHETYQEIRGVRYPMDEREIIAEILADERGRLDP